MKKKNRCADEFPSSSIRKYIGYPDSAYIHFDEVGAVLFIFRANPSLKELDGFEKKFEIRITEFQKSCLSLFALDLLTGAASHILHT